jgi:hypothetical protein
MGEVGEEEIIWRGGGRMGWDRCKNMVEMAWDGVGGVGRIPQCLEVKSPQILKARSLCRCTFWPPSA